MNRKWKRRLRPLHDRLELLRDMSKTVVIDPRHGLDDAFEHLCRRFEHPAPAVTSLRSPAWEQRLHQLLGAPWPCDCAAEFEPIWDDIGARLRDAGLTAGRGAYLGWDDGDAALARAAWCATRHLAPARVVETGVGRGIVTCAVLEALEMNGRGKLWSIDMPILLHPELAAEVGVAVPPERRSRWQLVEGSSRRQLRPLLAEVGAIDLFIHDSLHTARNVRFELDQAWPSLPAGGVALVDDVHFNDGFHTWVEQTADAQEMFVMPDDEQALIGIAARRRAPGRFVRREAEVTVASEQPA